MNIDVAPQIAPTILLTDVSQRTWDVVVIGGGPAGATAAYLLAIARLDVLLVDKRSFPREKVCGGCISARAAALLESVDLCSLEATVGATPLRTFVLRGGRRQLELPLSGGWAMPRATFDTQLVRAAIDRGAHFVPETTASVDACEELNPSPRSTPDDFRTVQFQHTNGSTYPVRTRVVLAADGLGSPSTTRRAGMQQEVDPNARIGVAATLEFNGPEFSPGVVYMQVERHGYVGIVKFGATQLHVAAAIDPELLRDSTSVPEAVARLLDYPTWIQRTNQQAHDWQGTRPLTCHATRPAAHRVLQIGDAAGYIEPFTGEGIAWAIEGAIAVEPLARCGVGRWSPEIEENWTREYYRRIRARQSRCQILVRLLRSPRITRAGMLACQLLPAITRSVSRRILEPV